MQFVDGVGDKATPGGRQCKESTRLEWGRVGQARLSQGWVGLGGQWWGTLGEGRARYSSTG